MRKTGDHYTYLSWLFMTACQDVQNSAIYRLLRRKPTAAENVSWEMINRLHGPVSDDVSTND